jgi:predicted lipoprotein with Yx(FWY)xxD motif
MKFSYGTQHFLGDATRGFGRAAGLRAAALSAAAASLVAAAVGFPLLAGTTAAAAAPAATGTVITTATRPFGTALVVGSGRYKGYSLYFITSDYGRHFGCTATPVRTIVGKLLCTGPSNDKQAEWPAITTVGRPIAQGGVSQSELGTVKRAHVGTQITYYGHPLYLFDQGPGQVTGEGWDEPSLPPWHGVWNLIAPSGIALPWPGALTITTIGGQAVLAAPMLTGVGWLNFPVYSYSSDVPFSGSSACTGACARLYPPVLTSGYPGVTSASMSEKVGTLTVPSGIQVAYDGQPLYLFSNEGLTKTASGYAATGSGNGLSYGTGTFHLVSP